MQPKTQMDGRIKQLNAYAKFLISFAVTSLFTNISLEETINIATDTIFESYLNALPNLFMAYHEKDWIEKAQVAKPKFYKRYADDIFAVFESELEAETFRTSSNNKHKIIKFTWKKQIENKLPFLDILISYNEIRTYRLQFSIRKCTQDSYLIILTLFKILIYGLVKALTDCMCGINN